MVSDAEMEPKIPPRKGVSSDRRTLTDRRAKPTSFLSRYWLTGRRRGGRRAGEDIDIYVDRYSTFEWLIIAGVFVLSFADLIFTLIHLASGGVELNPIMAWASRGGSITFSAIKLGVTVTCLSLLLIHIRFRRINFLLAFAFLVYAGVFVYHKALAFFIN